MPESESILRTTPPRLSPAAHELLSRFDNLWLQGQRPNLDDLLAECPHEERLLVLVELVHTDLEFRLKAGEDIQTEVYLRRYPELSARPEVAAGLIAAEFRGRSRRGTADPTAFAARFPEYAAHIEQLAREHAGRTTIDFVSPTDTTPPVQAPSAVHFGPLRLPGYEILSELGRGGMGVVFKARHLKLNRVVALKMILAGSHAGEAELARFQTEAEAIARLQHPHIVQVHEVGEHEGKPFFSLEFCGGGSLNHKLNGTPLPAREAAQLVETLARAVQAAHAQQIIHRDLKPANVLLADDGMPKITDFGLAKKLDEAGQTHSGAIIGTPSYMAPEQAGGKTSDIGPSADVYALGAILYECLTGRPPFKAATVMETLRQVVNDEPVSPTQLQSQTPRDLETICLKCLHKETSKRYAGALELADDLGRFLRGEPVQARPVGWLERATKWVRRNPTVAGSLAGVAGALLLGTAVSVFFGVDANQQATQAGQDKAAALTANTNLKNANTSLTTALKDVKEAQYNQEGSVARSLLIPLSLKSGPVSEQETEALAEVAANRQKHLAIRFVEEARKEPMYLRRIGVRPQYTLHAAVGLDAGQRAEVERILVERLSSKGTSADEGTDLSSGLVALGDLDPRSASQAADALIQALTRTNDPVIVRSIAESIAAIAAHLAPKEAARVSAEAATTLAQLMTHTNDLAGLPYLAQGLSAVVSRLEPQVATRVCTEAVVALTQAMTKVNNNFTIQSMAQSLSELAAPLEPKEAAKAAATLTRAMRELNDVFTLKSLAQGLWAVAARMEPKEASRVSAEAAATLLRLMAKTDKGNRLMPQVELLSVFAAHLDHKEAARASTEAAVKLAQAMNEVTDPTDIWFLALSLSRIAARLEPKDAAQVAAIITQTISKTTNTLAVRYQAYGLLAVAPRLEPKETAKAAAVLTQALTQPLMSQPMYNEVGWNMRHDLSVVAACLEPQEAGQVAEALTQAMSTMNGHGDLWDLAQFLKVVATRLEPKKAAEVATSLTQAISKTNNPRTRQYLTEGLSAVAGRLDPKEAASVSAEAIATLTQAMTKATNSQDLWSLRQGIFVLADRLEPTDAGQAVIILTQIMNQTTNPQALSPLAWSMSALAYHLEPRVAAQAAATLLQAISRTNDSATLVYLVQGLSAVAARLDLKEAARMCADGAAALTKAMNKTNDTATIQRLGQGIGFVAEHLESREAARVSAEAAAKLLQAMDKTSDPSALRSLALELSALARYLEPQIATGVFPKATATLIQAMNKTTEPAILRLLAEGLLGLVVHLEPKEAAEVAVTLIQAMSKTTNTANLQYLTQGLSGVLIPEPSSQRRQRVRSVTHSVGFGIYPPLLPLMFPVLSPALTPLAEPLPTATLVELLKHPLCVGEARRAVLDALGIRYHRSFADQWEFVHFAEDQKLDLDLTSPPKRR